MADALFESRIKSLPLIARGKVRDIYAIDDATMLIVTTDRLSAFDVILPDPIPGKGKVLTAVSNFWFDRLAGVSPNHLTGIAPESVVSADERDQVEGRAIVVRRLKPLPIEAVVRGYLIGSGWGDYSRTGSVCGVALPHGLRMASKLPAPIFTPATKAAAGDHDENISYAQTEALIGAALAAQVRDTAIALYSAASDYAKSRGIIIADTKFEFGLDPDGKAHSDRRGADPGFVTLLAGRPVPGRRQSAVLRQAVRARLPGNAGLEQERPRPIAAGRHHPAHRRQVPRSADPPHRLIGFHQVPVRVSPTGPPSGSVGTKPRRVKQKVAPLPGAA